MVLLIILFIILYCILAFKRLDWAVMLLIAALPTYLIRFQVLGIPLTVLELMILISFATWFICHTELRNFIRGKYGWKELKDNRQKRKKYPFGPEIILLLFISWIAIITAGLSDMALGIWKAYFFTVVAKTAIRFLLILRE